MTDLEIYELAGNVILSITKDMQESIYSNLNGNLLVVWRELVVIRKLQEGKNKYENCIH